MRYSEIRKELVNLTDTMLSSALKELTDDGIVERRQYETIPPKVEYALTGKGLTVVPILQSICAWSSSFHHVDEMNKLTQCQTCDFIRK